MLRPEVPQNHEYLNAYYYAMTNAMLTWDGEDLNRVKDILLDTDEWTEEDFDSALFYKPLFFKYRVKRIAPDVPFLYFAVRAVYVTFGNKRDSQTGEPLFDDAAWKKAQELLDEIKEGYYTDPPNTSSDAPYAWYGYHFDDDEKTVRRDRYGIKMLNCRRGIKEAGQRHLYY